MLTFSQIRIQNFRSISDSGNLSLGSITVLIGANSSGKSSLLRSVLLAHGGAGYSQRDVRYGEASARVQFRITPTLVERLARTVDANYGIDWGARDLKLEIAAVGGRLESRLKWNEAGSGRDFSLPSRRPDHVIVPVLSRRKADSYETAVRRELATTVGLDDRSLVSRLSGLAGDHAEGRRYRELMHRMVGLEVASYVGDEGPVPGIPLGATSGIDLERMGEGVRSVVTLASELADNSTPRVFVLEEPENDRHPSALDPLLQVIREESERHQFIVSTHNDRVLRELGSVRDAAVYEVSVETDGGLPTTKFRELGDVFERREALAALGYEETLPIGWIVFEESSAERFVRDGLIPLFAPRLSALRTVSASGAGNLPRIVTALHHMILFAHLADRANARAWVLADGDRAGVAAVGKLRSSFESWPESRFQVLPEVSIEKMYPARFADDVAALERVQDSRSRTHQKGLLAERVARWAATEPDLARRELAISAAGLVEHLIRIDAEVVDLQRELDGL